MDKLKLIKTIVVLITFLLVFGSLLLLGMLFKKTRATPMPTPEHLSLEEPIGSQIQHFTEKDGLLFLNIKNGGLSDRIVIYNYNSGKKISTIKLY